MANEYAVNAADLQTIADAIREKGETEETFVFPAGFVSAIQSISTGVGLNFNVQAYESADSLPETAEENTIAVITDTEITGYMFASAEPQTPAEGMVWFATGSDSEISFSATKENGIYVYPLSSKQYISGEWNAKEIYAFQNGEWKQPTRYLFNAGETFDTLTGGWEGYSRYNASVTRNSDSFLIQGYNGGYQEAGIQTLNMVDLTDYSKLYFTGSVNVVNGNTDSRFLGIQNKQVVGYQVNTGQWFEHVAYVNHPAATGSFTLSVDISSYTGAYYVGCHTGDEIIISKVWLEV